MARLTNNPNHFLSKSIQNQHTKYMKSFTPRGVNWYYLTINALNELNIMRSSGIQPKHNRKMCHIANIHVGVVFLSIKHSMEYQPFIGRKRTRDDSFIKLPLGFKISKCFQLNQLYFGRPHIAHSQPKSSNSPSIRSKPIFTMEVTILIYIYYACIQITFTYCAE